MRSSDSFMLLSRRDRMNTARSTDSTYRAVRREGTGATGAYALYGRIFTSSVVKIWCTILATSCECERRASALRWLHMYNRVSMTEGRLSSLALMHIH